MSEAAHRISKGVVLLCFDGSDNAVLAIARAGEMLGSRTAVVLSVWEPVAVWHPYDPATAITAPFSRLASRALGLDEIARELAEEQASAGTALARQAGFDAREQDYRREAMAGDLRCRRRDRGRADRARSPWALPGSVGSARERVRRRGRSTHAGRCWSFPVRPRWPERRATSSRTGRALRSRRHSRPARSRSSPARER